MKKLLLLLSCVLICLLLGGCGNPKKEAAGLYDKYYGENGSVAKLAMDVYKKSAKSGITAFEMRQIYDDYNSGIAKMTKELQGTKVDQSNEKLKTCMLDVLQTIERRNASATAFYASATRSGSDFSGPSYLMQQFTSAENSLKLAQYKLYNEYALVTTGKNVPILRRKNKNIIGRNIMVADGDNKLDFDFAIANPECSPQIVERSHWNAIFRPDVLQAPPGQKYVTFDLLLKNNSRNDKEGTSIIVTFKDTDFTLIDDKGKTYQQDPAVCKTLGMKHPYAVKAHPGGELAVLPVGFMIPAETDASATKIKMNLNAKSTYEVTVKSFEPFYYLEIN